jgi:hypothetical protein
MAVLAWRGPCSRPSSASGVTLRVRFAVAAATSALERASAADDSSLMDSGSGLSGSVALGPASAGVRQPRLTAVRERPLVTFGDVGNIRVSASGEGLPAVARQNRELRRPNADRQPEPDARWRSGRHAGPGRSCLPVVEAADVSNPAAPHGQHLPAPHRPPASRAAGVPVTSSPTSSAPSPTVTSVATARAPAARAPAHHAMTWSRLRQSASAGPSGAPQRAPGRSSADALERPGEGLPRGQPGRPTAICRASRQPDHRLPITSAGQASPHGS